ncbi:hypothetical protein F5X96DRAFT_487480 [Biscogniauxia mediterranea]|nr:hypothetical protein F5X96DRAFT_487480 [Biscogniauxia mediterranea]
MGHSPAEPRNSTLLSKLWNGDPRYDYLPVCAMNGNTYSPATTTKTAEKGSAARSLRRKRRWQGYGICSAVWSLTILVGISLLGLFLALGQRLWGQGYDPDKIFSNWGKPGTGTQALAWYPTDFLRDVMPIPCHSHNDYWRKVPLFSALHVGCVGVEADVWLIDGKPDLYVGHDTAALQPNRTFQSLYVNPLVELLERSNPQTEFYNDNRRGVFDADPDQTVALLVDLKTDGAQTWPEVLKQLEPLRSRNWLSYVEDGVVHKRQVTVIGTGNTPFDLLVQNTTYRDAFFDAPLSEMWEDPDAPDSTPLSISNTTFKYNPTNSFYASTSLKDAVGLIFAGLSEAQLRIVRGQIKGAHRRGLKVRYWDTPSWPIGLRDKIWHTLMEEGADILNVDDLKSASQKKW